LCAGHSFFLISFSDLPCGNTTIAAATAQVNAGKSNKHQGYKGAKAARSAGGQLCATGILIIRRYTLMNDINHNFKGNVVIRGDTLRVLKEFPDDLFGGIITDPPYASGAADQNARQKSTAQKYSSAKPESVLPDFEGDSKDQRSWTNWMTEWLQEARRCTKPGAPICMFIDWRQLPNMTDALQWAGWIWRGVLVWDKTNSRPQRGRFRQQAEFIVWGSNGHMPVDRTAPVLPGVFRQSMPAAPKRIHQTEKPLEVMRDIIKIVEPGGIILDPFAGAGTTVLAAKLEDYPAVGIELSYYYAEAAAKRIEDCAAPEELPPAAA
jgi:site-specific DNA-methyltransferase (adenine-specific)